MRHIKAALAFIGLMILVGGCGDSEPEPAQADDTVSASGASCEIFPAGLIERVGMAYQLVRNLALAGGKNVATMEKNMGLPDPETFRSFAAAFERLDVSAVEALPNFDTPQVAAPAIREMADKLEAALAHKENLDHAAWAELAEFSKRRQNRQQSSINYYLSQLHCK